MPSVQKINRIKKRVKSSKIVDMKRVFSALSDETRLKSLVIFLENDVKDLCVTDVAEVLEITVPAASYQLSKLEEAGFLKKTKNGRRVCYRLNKDNDLIETIKGRLS